MIGISPESSSLNEAILYFNSHIIFKTSPVAVSVLYYHEDNLK